MNGQSVAIGSKIISGKPAKLLKTLEKVLENSNISCTFELASGESRKFGTGKSMFHIKLNNDKVLRFGFNEFALAKAYVDGELEIEGSVMHLMELRSQLKEKNNLSIFLNFLGHLYFKSANAVNHNTVAAHYNYGDDLYLSFIDKKYRFYSHGIFKTGNETLEESSENKLKTMYDSLKLKPGMRLLDIGAGWGCVPQYCGPQGVHVTSLTLAQDSFNYTSNLIKELNLENCKVIREDFLEHTPDEPYDAIVIYGVIEHIPYYQKFCDNLWQCLKPGGYFYLDASATVEKFDVSDFIRYYIWQGTHSYMSLQDITRELLYHGMEIVEVVRETNDYGLTMHHWASRFEANKDFIVNKWGDELYRIFRLYLWGGSHAFKINSMQAYHLVAQKNINPGLRPGMLKRFYYFIRNSV